MEWRYLHTTNYQFNNNNLHWEVLGQQHHLWVNTIIIMMARTFFVVVTDVVVLHCHNYMYIVTMHCSPRIVPQYENKTSTHLSI